MTMDRAIYTVADALLLPIADKSVHMIATSPPYWGLRSYLPNIVCIKRNLSDEERRFVLDELERLGIKPTSL